jgi:LacI family transcriptional regulator
VLSDNVTAGQMAARHLLERGFKQFVFAAPDVRGHFASRERLDGFRATLASHGHRVKVLDGRNAVKASQASSIYQCADWLAGRLRTIPKPFAVFCTNDDFAVDILDACSMANILVPEEAAVVGCDNDELICPLASVPLTSVDLNLEEVAYQGARLLDQLMNGRRAPRRPVRVPCRGVVTRRSSDILAVEHLGVAKALRFILDHHTNPLIGVADAAAAAGMSRRGLGLVFHRLVGRHVSEEIAWKEPWRCSPRANTTPPMLPRSVAIPGSSIWLAPWSAPPATAPANSRRTSKSPFARGKKGGR